MYNVGNMIYVFTCGSSHFGCSYFSTTKDIDLWNSHMYTTGSHKDNIIS